MITVAGLGGRLPLQPPEILPPPARALYDRLVGGRLGRSSPFRSRTDAGELIGPFNACLYTPLIGAGFLDFHEAEEAGTTLSTKLREVVILSVGAVWKSDYELYAHRAVASAKAGFSADVVDALAAGKACEGMSEVEQAVQRFTLELTRDRRVTDAVYSAAERHLGREALIAAAFLAAAYNGTCLMLNAFAIPAPAS